MVKIPFDAVEELTCNMYLYIVRFFFSLASMVQQQDFSPLA